MPVHTHESRLKVVMMVFEARYDEGFRMLDNIGEMLVRIRKQKPSWTINAVGQQLASLHLAQSGLLLNVGVSKMDFSVIKQVPLADAEKQASILGREAASLYELITEVLKLPRTTRAGTRFAFLAPADNLEESDRFIQRGSSSPLLAAVAESTKSEPVESQFVYVLDDPKTNFRRRVTLNSVMMEQKPEDPPFIGLPGDVGSGGVVVDIDTYFRPTDSHLAKSELFVQENFLHSRAEATKILKWLLNQQK